MSNLPSDAQNKADPFKAMRSAVDRYQNALGLLDGERSFEDGMHDAVSVEEAWRRLQAVLETLKASEPQTFAFEPILIQTGESRRTPWYTPSDLFSSDMRIPYRVIEMEGSGFVCLNVYWNVCGKINNPTWTGQWGTRKELRLSDYFHDFPWPPHAYTRGELEVRMSRRKPLCFDDLLLADDPLALALNLTAHAEEALRLVAERLEQQAAMIEQLRPHQRRAP